MTRRGWRIAWTEQVLRRSFAGTGEAAQVAERQRRLGAGIPARTRRRPPAPRTLQQPRSRSDTAPRPCLGGHGTSYARACQELQVRHRSSPVPREAWAGGSSNGYARDRAAAGDASWCSRNVRGGDNHAASPRRTSRLIWSADVRVATSRSSAAWRPGQSDRSAPIRPIRDQRCRAHELRTLQPKAPARLREALTTEYRRVTSKETVAFVPQERTRLPQKWQLRGPPVAESLEAGDGSSPFRAFHRRSGRRCARPRARTNQRKVPPAHETQLGIPVTPDEADAARIGLDWHGLVGWTQMWAHLGVENGDFGRVTSEPEHGSCGR